jgi:hypothetical protein
MRLAMTIVQTPDYYARRDHRRDYDRPDYDGRRDSRSDVGHPHQIKPPQTTLSMHSMPSVPLCTSFQRPTLSLDSDDYSG